MSDYLTQLGDAISSTRTKLNRKSVKNPKGAPTVSMHVPKLEILLEAAAITAQLYPDLVKLKEAAKHAIVKTDFVSVDRYADNGEFSHTSLIRKDNGETIAEEMDGYIADFFAVAGNVATRIGEVVG